MVSKVGVFHFVMPDLELNDLLARVGSPSRKHGWQIKNCTSAVGSQLPTVIPDLVRYLSKLQSNRRSLGCVKKQLLAR